jgi:hypothetical protein
MNPIKVVVEEVVVGGRLLYQTTVDGQVTVVGNTTEVATSNKTTANNRALRLGKLLAASKKRWVSVQTIKGQDRRAIYHIDPEDPEGSPDQVG